MNTNATNSQARIIANPDQSTMILILDTVGFSGFTQSDDGKWRAVGTWKIPPACIQQEQGALEGKFTLVPPTPDQPDIDISGWRAHFEANGNICNTG